MLNVLLLFFLLFSGLSASSDDTLILQLKDGKIRGRQLVTKDENKIPYIAFQGIPYAKPPIDDLRFQLPQPPEKWQNIWDTTKDAAICLQPDMLPDQIISEDCLYLNVYTPNLNGSYPVMVWIYGGAFIIGSDRKANYGPDYMIQENVVIVAPNYRVGIFGFLSTEDDVVSGNYALKDQIFALKWVKDNIQNFGGDPNHVTIFGESAGSVSVSLLLQAKSAEGLYHGAIMESGVSLSPFSLIRFPREVAFACGKYLNISANTSKELVTELRKVNAKVLLDTSIKNFLTVSLVTNPLNGLAFAPSLEDPSPDAILTQKSYEQLRKGDFIQVPVMVGFNSAEGNAFDPVRSQVPILIMKYDLNHKLLIPIDMNVNDSSTKEVASKIKNYYFGTKSIRSQPEFLSKFITDDQFLRPTNEYVRLISNYTTTYFYEFSYVGNLSGAVRTLPGVGHSEELYYLWKVKNRNIGYEDIPVRTKMVKMWTNFAKYGHPTPNAEPSLDNVIWQQSNPTNLPYLHIESTLEMKTNPREKDIKFWTDLYQTYGNPPYDTY